MLIDLLYRIGLLKLVTAGQTALSELRVHLILVRLDDLLSFVRLCSSEDGICVLSSLRILVDVLIDLRLILRSDEARAEDIVVEELDRRLSLVALYDRLSPLIDLREVCISTCDRLVVLDLISQDLRRTDLSIITEVSDTVVIELHQLIEDLLLFISSLSLTKLPVKDLSTDDVYILRCCGAVIVCLLPMLIGVGIVRRLTKAGQQADTLAAADAVFT